jgi:hypothetical protein
MISFRKAAAIAAVGCFTGLLCGCASSNLIDVWHDASRQVQPMEKMLVIAVRKDAAKRRIWEDAFAGELINRGVAATTSYSLFPNAPPDTNQVVAAAQASGFEGILVILRLPTKKMLKPTSEEQNVNYTSYWQRYLTYYRDADYPGDNGSQSVAMRSIDVTTTGPGGKLIWSAKSRTPDPGSVPDAQAGVAGLVVSKLARQNVIISKK